MSRLAYSARRRVIAALRRAGHDPVAPDCAYSEPWDCLSAKRSCLICGGRR